MAAERRNLEHRRSIKIANISSMTLILFMNAVYIFEVLMDKILVNWSFVGVVMIAGFLMSITIVKNTINPRKLAFNMPFFIQVYYTALMLLNGWSTSHYMVVCVALSAISCIYINYYRTAIYITIQHIIIGILLLNGQPVLGPEAALFTILINWVLCIFGSIIMIVLTRSATIVLSKAVENKNSFRDLLDTTENYVAMIDGRNEVVYASKTLSRLSNVEEPELVQGRPLIDLFPGQSLKVQAGELLKEKEDYAKDWEFSLYGQKRFFKAVSHSLPGGSQGTLISLYDMTHLAERDEIAAMKDSMKIGLFFMDSEFVIQDHYSRYLEELLSDTRLFGRKFTDVIADSITPSELEATKDYFKMVLEGTYDQEMLEEINPLTELYYFNRNNNNRKVFQCEFNTVERGHGERFILVTIYDITMRVELQQQLAAEEARRQEEMQSVFELIQISPSVFNDFMQDTEHEFDAIDKILKNEKLTAKEALVKVYQSVHAVKSNAVILGLNVFGNKVHDLESKIKKLREYQGDVPFNEMLNLTMDIEKLSNEKEGFKEIIKKLESYTGTGTGAIGGTEDQNVKVLVDSLAKTASRGAEDLEKQIKFVANDIDKQAVLNGPRRIMKEILMQLVRNAVVHGIEAPDERKAKGKNTTGLIKLSITYDKKSKIINLRLSDDGKGLDYKKIAERAVMKGLIKKEHVNNKDILIKAIFSPGFSTADVEGIHGGRGIGLNLVRDRIKEINGNIKLKSEADKGTIFLITIPLNPAAN